ncbi:GAF domain-containing protein [Brucella oryzae]|uniref:GAF domain-containing protein n=1 Tax=Brucella oryzae TaxID=335286 RepID=UPI0024AF2A81|nr:helix-turn-helix domain-containing protein [Brucella oryzae]
MVSRDRLDQLRSLNFPLRTAAQAAFSRVGCLLDDAGAMLLLCDRSGFVLEAVGDARILSLGEEDHLHPGGHWAEKVIGTNAIGTALHVGRPVSIRGAEHFGEEIQRWSCAAAPVRDPKTGQVLGVVDISAPSENDMRQSAALSVSLALQIEEALRSAGLRERERLIGTILEAGPTRGGADVVILDRYGEQVWVSDTFERIDERLGAIAALINQPNMELDGDMLALAGRLCEVLPGVGVDLIREQGEELGLLITFPSTTRPRTPTVMASRTSGEARPRHDETLRGRERAQILETVTACEGNISQTARCLGISRSTLYLKLEQYGVSEGQRREIRCLSVGRASDAG